MSVKDVASPASTYAQAGEGPAGSDSGPAARSVASQDIPAGTAPLRAVFMGTPAFAARILAAVLESSLVHVAAVYTQPDRPSGRGNQLKAPEVKELALERGLPVYQPEHFKRTPEGDAAVEALAALKPDVLLVAAYGLLLPQRVLDIPTRMPINVHASLLPRYRGAAPIQRAIMNGDAVTGLTIMRMEAALDSGPILLQRAMGIDLNDTSASLHDELAAEGGSLLVEALGRLAVGSLRSFPQDDSLATYAPKLTKEEAFLDLRQPVHTLHARIRGLSPWPGAMLLLRRPDQPDLQVSLPPGTYPITGPLPDAAKEGGAMCAAGEGGSEPSPCSPGSILRDGGSLAPQDALLVRCGDGWYAFPELRPAGKKTMSGRAFFNGYLKDALGAHFVGVGA